MEEKAADRIQELLDELESICPNTGGSAEVTFDYEDAQVVADETALLRLGVGIAAGSRRPLVSRHGYGDAVDHRADDVLSSPSSIAFTIRRVDVLVPTSENGTTVGGWRDAALCIGCAVVVFLMMSLMAMGVVQVVTWIRS